MPFLIAAAAVIVAVIVAMKNKDSPQESQSPRQQFAARMLDAMSRVDMRSIKKDLALALFSLETDYGMGDIFQHTNNPGSIKSTVGWAGKPSYKSTRVYPTLEDGIRDWVRLISEASIYRNAYTAAKSGDYKGFFVALGAAGYEVALKPPYSARLERVYGEVKREGLA